MQNLLVKIDAIHHDYGFLIKAGILLNTETKFKRAYELSSLTKETVCNALLSRSAFPLRTSFEKYSAIYARHCEAFDN